jgi:hypothetical protein
MADIAHGFSASENAVSQWMPRGKQLRVPTLGMDRKKSVSSAMDVWTGLHAPRL